ncbi:MAG: FtsX-like permease family protein, partial [Rhodovibrionaceae bacterium]
MRGSLMLAARLARRELRGGLKGFRIFLGCIALGVAAIAAVGSISSSMLSGLEKNGRVLLGGEVELRLIHRAATAEELAWMEEHSSEISTTAEMRAMARSSANPDDRRLVEMKAVDDAYPLYGSFGIEPEIGITEALAKDGGLWGAVADESLLSNLGMEIGDELQVGDVRYRIRGTVGYEPDRATRIFTLGPRLLVSRASLAESGLEQPGSLIYYHYRMTLPEGVGYDAWKAELEADHPRAGWRLRDLDTAAPGIERFVERVSLFMTLVGLTALLVGGVGVANAVRSYLDSKTATIATLKCLGAPGRLVFQVYLLQVLALSLLGIAAGLVLGGITPSLAGPLLSQQLNFTITGGLHLQPLALAALFGVLTTLAFGLWPLARAQGLPAATLFRDLVAPARSRPPNWALVAIAAAGGALIATAVLGTSDSLFALGFVGGAIAALLAFRLAALGVTDLARRLPRPRHPGLRLAVANLHRPGNPTGSVVMSLGLGVTVLVAIALI